VFVLTDGTKTNGALLLHYGFTLAQAASKDTVELQVSLSEGRRQLLSRAGFATAVSLEAIADEDQPPPVSLLAPMRVATLSTEEATELVRMTPENLRHKLECGVGVDNELRALAALCTTIDQRSRAVAEAVQAAQAERQSAEATADLDPSAERTAGAWVDAMRYIDGQLDVLDSHHYAGLRSYRQRIAARLKTETTSGGLCCSEAVARGERAASFPESTCITCAKHSLHHLLVFDGGHAQWPLMATEVTLVCTSEWQTHVAHRRWGASTFKRRCEHHP
jgi:hypothetical protein